MDTVDVIIIGSGPAAWTAALYATRARLKTRVYTGVKWGGQRGGQLTTTTEVENYPGFPLGVTGPELIRLMEDQARRFDAEVLEEDVIELELSSKPFVVRGSATSMRTRAIIIATGAYAKRLDIPGDKEFWNRGISACAICDGALPFFRNQPLAVVGGGDTACEEALYLTKYGSEVNVIVRKGELRASKIMQDRLKENPKIKIIYQHTVEKALGKMALEGIEIKHVETGAVQTLPVKGLFYAIGHQPNTELVKGKLDLDEVGYLKVTPGTSYTSFEGVFGAGDVYDRRYRQAITAAGMGCMAALDAERWLSEHG